MPPNNVSISLRFPTSRPAAAQPPLAHVKVTRYCRPPAAQARPSYQAAAAHQRHAQAQPHDQQHRRRSPRTAASAAGISARRATQPFIICREALGTQRDQLTSGLASPIRQSAYVSNRSQHRRQRSHGNSFGRRFCLASEPSGAGRSWRPPLNIRTCPWAFAEVPMTPSNRRRPLGAGAAMLPPAAIARSCCPTAARLPPPSYRPAAT